MSRLAIFLDGGYVAKIFKETSNPPPRVDFQKMIDYIHQITAPNAELFRTYYYDCAPYQSTPPTAEEATRYASKMKFYGALENLPKFQLRLGRLAKRTNTPGQVEYEQKGVDVLFAVDLVSLSAKHAINHAVICTGDADMLHAVQVAKSEGVTVHLIHGDTVTSRPGQDLWKASDVRHPISLATVQTWV